MTDREAAERVGIDPGRAAYIKAKPRVKAYMEEYRAAVRAGMVQREVDVLSEFNISREEIIAQYWGFTRLDPKTTNGNIAGQVRALDSLRDMLGFGSPQPGQKSDAEGEAASKPQVYVVKWLREARNQDPRDPDEEGGDGSREPSTPREAVMGHPNSPAPRPTVAPQSPTMTPSGNTATRSAEPTGRWAPARRVSGAFRRKCRAYRSPA
jgi:hypothetical protein